jgi:predicted PurR-regulated permease PerM
VPQYEGPAPPADHTRIIVGWIGVALLVYLVYLVVRPFLLALGWAAVFAIVVHPLHDRLLPRLGRSRAAAVSTVAVSLALIVPAALILPVFAREAFDAAAHIQRVFMEGRYSAFERIWDGLAGVIPVSQQADLAVVLSEGLRRVAAFVVGQSGLILRDAAAFVFQMIVGLFATFFLLRDSALVMRMVRRLLPMPRRNREELITQTSRLVVVGVTSAVIVASVQGLLGGIVFWAVGIDGPVFWGVVMALFCLLPFGAWVVWLPASLLLAANGETTRAILLGAMGLGIVSAVDNVLRPMLVSGRAHINGLVILVGLLGGVNVFGLLGIVLGPILVATAIALLRAYAGDAPRHQGRTLSPAIAIAAGTPSPGRRFTTVSNTKTGDR